MQGIPAVFAVLKGQPRPAVPGRAARGPGAPVPRRAAPGRRGQRRDRPRPGRRRPADEAAAEPEADPRWDEAYDAIERGDLDAAAARTAPCSPTRRATREAQAGLGQVELLRRTQGLDPAETRKLAAERPDDVAAQTAAADLDLLGGHVEDAFSRLLDLVRRLSGDDRDAVRTHLVGLFELVGNRDDRVAKARTALANALF